jgi:hypothetical protein
VRTIHEECKQQLRLAGGVFGDLTRRGGRDRHSGRRLLTTRETGREQGLKNQPNFSAKIGRIGPIEFKNRQKMLFTISKFQTKLKIRKIYVKN